MQTSTVIGAGLARHPESNENRMKVTVDHPYAQGGQTYGSTDIWGPATMPEPQFGESIQWGSRHIWFRGVRYAKPEYDSNPADSLH